MAVGYMIFPVVLLFLASLASAATGNAKAGGAGYAYSFDGLMGTTISMQWAHAPISRMTVEYWMNIMDPHLTQQPVFAYSAYNVGGRYSEGGAPYENANEVVILHAPTYHRLFRVAPRTRTPD